MSNVIDKMSPDASPSSSVNVRTVNNWPLYLLFAVVFCFLVVIGLVSMDRAEKQNQILNSTPEEKSQKSTYEFAKGIVGDQKDGIIATLDRPEPEQPNSEVIQIARPSNLDIPPRPPASAELKQPPQDDQKARIRQLKMQQLEAALKAKTSIQFEAARARNQGSSYTQVGSGSVRNGMTARSTDLKELNEKIAAANSATQIDPMTAYKERLKQIQGGLGSGSQNNRESTPNNNYEQFAGEGQKDRWQLNSQSEAPRSQYELRAGFVVPATLISGINSELPGQIMAQVSQDVFDTATGKWKLIPQGSHLVGSYSNQISSGQSRVLIAWQRIIFPDGKAMDIGAMPGADSAGYAGFTDQVNNHLLRLYGSAVLMSAVTAGFSMSQPQATAIGTAQNANSALSQALGQQLGQTTSQMISKNMNISPTLEIRPGYRFNVVVIKDLTFYKPYQAFDY